MKKKYILMYLNLSEKHLDLLQLFFKSNVSQEELADFFLGIDIEKQGLEKASLIAHLCIKTNYQGVPENLVPRIKGILKFWISHNARLMMNALELIRTYNQQEIPVLLCKGAAMRLGYMPKVSRNMWDVDITVPVEKYREAVLLATDTGYDAYPSIHSTDLKKSGDIFIDIHPIFYKASINHPEKQAGVWHRSTEIISHGAKMQLPCIEDMLIQIMSNPMLDIADRANKSHLKWLSDSMYLILQYPEIKWDKLCAIARQTGIGYQICFCFDMINSLFPKVIDYPYLQQQLMGDRGSQYKLRQFIKQRAAAETYWESKDRQILICSLIPWIKFNWYRNCFYNGGSNTLENIKSFPHYLQQYMGTNRILDSPKIMLGRLKKYSEKGPGLT